MTVAITYNNITVIRIIFIHCFYAPNELALQQNESVDIFLETFHLVVEDEFNEIALSDNDLREIKNFADPNYSKFKALAAIDWVPKSSGLIVVNVGALSPSLHHQPHHRHLLYHHHRHQVWWQ